MAWVKVERAEKKVEPFSVDFAYTGTVQEYVVPVTGLYKLEVWGGQGQGVQTGGWNDEGDREYGSISSAKGGYSVGYIKLKKNTTLYIVCGGVTYNGGGTQYGNGGSAGNDVNDRFGNGAGATHIAKVTGLLADIGKDLFDKQGLIVAGGSGGCFSNTWNWNSSAGGAGGGLTGGGNSPGGQTSGGGTFGKGNSATSSSYGAGGGGGYYGGGGRLSGGGGSGWIGGVPAITYKGTAYNPSTSNGVNSGNGKAKISYIA